METLSKIGTIAKIKSVRNYENGIIKVNPVGGINLTTLPSSRVVLQNNNNKFYDGVINVSSNVEKTKDLCFDFGFDNEEEVLKNDISVGNSVYYVGDTVRINNKRIIQRFIQ